MSLDSAISSLTARLEQVSSRLAAVEKELSSGGGSTKTSTTTTSSSSSGEAVASASVNDFEDLINQFIQPLVSHSSKLGANDVVQQVDLLLKAVNAQRDLLKVAASCKKPSDDVFQRLLKPTVEVMEKIVNLRDTNRTSKFFNQLSTISEGIGALSWVLVSPTPGPHVAEMRGASEFYSNKILKDARGKDQNQVDWVTSYNTFLKELQAFIKKHHTTGLTWNPRGGDAASFSVGSSSSEESGGVPPPPPGPPPPPIFTESSSSSSNKNQPDMANVFAELNKGEGVTSGLKKVTSDMKTKNRTDKVSVVPAKDAPSHSSKTETTGKKDVTKPPKFSLDGNKWAVEWQIGNKNIIIDQTEPKQTVYIYKCKDSVIQIKGKINTVTVDDCQKTAIVFENCIASFEVVNCRSVEVQVTGKVPNFAIDKTSGCQLYLSKEALEAEIITSKSDQLNVSLPDSHGEMIELPIPEQYKTVVKGSKLHTEVVQHV